ncbi:MAG: hypothetical protein JSV21_00250 [Nitrospirota bacterium]|nr:MAG: hypothetical protein JSV21_00250 [Nitrospirota bacterium]
MRLTNSDIKKVQEAHDNLSALIKAVRGNNSIDRKAVRGVMKNLEIIRSAAGELELDFQQRLLEESGEG